MAVEKITQTKLNLNKFGKLDFKACTATDGFEIDFDCKDFLTLLIFRNKGSAGAKTVTVKAGNGLQGVTDLEKYSIPQNELHAIRIDSGHFKNVTGAKNGKVIVTTDATSEIECCAVVLPY